MRRLGGRDTTDTATRTWRVTTAIRVFGLALAVGLVLAEGPPVRGIPLLAALAMVAGLCAALEWLARPAPLVWLNVGESLLVTILVASVPSNGGAAAYVAVPLLVTGVRHGWVATSNAALASGLAAATTLAASGPGIDQARAAQLFTWVLTGWGTGLLASWQSRSVRELEGREAPYRATHQLMAQLHDLTASGRVGLNVSTLATRLDSGLRTVTGAARSAVFVHDDRGQVTQLAAHGDTTDLLARVRPSTSPETSGRYHTVPLEGAGRQFGTAVLDRPAGWDDGLRRLASEVAQDHALRLDTALLFESVRLLATAEERNRIAREMHDGVAQELAGLGFAIDEIQSVAGETEVQELAAAVRDEISRMVAELRLSIFDLRHGITDGHLSAAIADYVREASRGSGLDVHLTLDESGPALPSRHQVEMLRIVQEAFGNVRKHSGAAHAWVHFSSNGDTFEVRIEDDGVGSAVPRERHWGLQSMQERAQQIDAVLTVSPRQPRGTCVLLRSQPATERTP